MLVQRTVETMLVIPYEHSIRPSKAEEFEFHSKLQLWCSCRINSGRDVPLNIYVQSHWALAPWAAFQTFTSSFVVKTANNVNNQMVPYVTIFPSNRYVLNPWQDNFPMVTDRYTEKLTYDSVPYGRSSSWEWQIFLKSISPLAVIIVNLPTLHIKGALYEGDPSELFNK